MKKLIPVLFAVFFLASCQKDPDLSNLSSDFLVFTNYDKTVDFTTLNTYYIADSILLINDSKDPQYWTGDNAQEIRDTYIKNMTSLGYARVMDKSLANIGIQVSYIESTSYFVNYNEPTWWWGYPGYWSPIYWGSWGDWYDYSYPVVYSYNVGSLLTEFVNLEAPEGPKAKLPIIWDSYLSGLLSGSNQFDQLLSIRAINQSFQQSPYLQK